jgi:16S rRNA (guanine527-N7)-methyltransferase
VTKKTGFLQAVVDALALENVTILAERAESVGQMPAHRERYDWAMARSVAHLGILVEYLLPLVAVGGNVLAQKGSSGERESAESTHAIATLGGGQHTIHTIQLPERELAHQLIVIPKIKPTPSQYPRRPGLPRKRPL